MFKKITTTILFLMSVLVLYAQAPDLYPPTVPKQVDITLFNLILYIILPIGLVVAFFWYQRSQKKKRKTDNDNRSEKNPENR